MIPRQNNNCITKKTKIMEEEIQKKYKQLDNKMNFIKELAAELGKQPRSIQSNWFAGFRIIPVKYQKKVLELIEKKLSENE